MASLTNAHKEAIRRSWEPVRAAKKDIGVAFMLALFENHPTYMDMFPALQAIPSDQLPTHAKLRAHGLTVILMLTSWVDNLDDLDVLVQLVRKNGYRHGGRGLTTGHFDSIWSMFPGFLSGKLGDAFDNAMAEGWAEALPVLKAVTDQALDDHAAGKEC